MSRSRTKMRRSGRRHGAPATRSDASCRPTSTANSTGRGWRRWQRTSNTAGGAAWRPTPTPGSRSRWPRWRSRPRPPRGPALHRAASAVRRHLERIGPTRRGMSRPRLIGWLRRLERSTRRSTPRPGRRWSGDGPSFPTTSRRRRRLSDGPGSAARAPTASSRAATSPARPATTPRTPTRCGSTGRTRSPDRRRRWPSSQATRAPHAHAQLIGGEVSLLDADDHAEALLIMRRHGREPMSFTHGDFDYDYLSASPSIPTASRASGGSPSPRTSTRRWSAAGASAAPTSEEDLDPIAPERSAPCSADSAENTACASTWPTT